MAGEILEPHDPEFCNCDRCRYWRWEMTLVVQRIEVIEQKPDLEWLDNMQRNEIDRFRQFLELEADGKISVPRGPFTTENGWVKTNDSLRWGGGPVPQNL